MVGLFGAGGAGPNLTATPNCKEETYSERIKKLEELVKQMIGDEDVESMALLGLVDNIQRLGLAYRFKKDIEQALHKIASFEGSTNKGEGKSLHETALGFRLLRQHGYDVCEDVFKSFTNRSGRFNACLYNDVKGLLSLYEASYLAFEGENILDEATAFTSIHLKDRVWKLDPCLAEQVSHSLELPLHRRVPRLEAREYIEAFARREDADLVLLELAVMSFNTVQSIHQRECQDMSRWWRETGLANSLSFIRDRITESFFCSLGMAFEPEFNNFSKGLTQVIALIVAIDHIYDVYASMEELEQFTNVVEKWSMDSTEKLSDSLKLCLEVLLNTVNEMANQNFEEQRVETRSHFKKPWADLCKAFLIEAKWQYTKYTPTFKEYMENAWVSSSVLVMLVHAYCLISRNITKEALGCFDERNDLLYQPCMLFQLCNDLASAMADLEGDETAKSILCYMRDTGVSEEFACEDMRNLIDETWKKMNESTQAVITPFPKQFIDVVLNFSRSVHCIYQHRDTFGVPDSTSRRRITKLLIEPVSSLFEE